MIHTNYDSKTGIITVVKSGVINYEQALSMLDIIDKKYGQKDTLYILEDSSTNKFNIHPSEISGLLSSISSKMNEYKEVRHADIVSTPLETALSYIYAAGAKFVNNYSYKSFSTQKAAIEWLKRGKNYTKST